MNLQGEVLLMRFGNLFSRYRAVSKWSGLLAAIAMALLTVAASAQMVGSEKGKKHRDTQKTEDQAKKKKVDEKAYEDALKSHRAKSPTPGKVCDKICAGRGVMLVCVRAVRYFAHNLSSVSRRLPRSAE